MELPKLKLEFWGVSQLTKKYVHTLFIKQIQFILVSALNVLFIEFLIIEWCKMTINDYSCKYL